MDFDDLYGTRRILTAIAAVQDTVNHIATQMGNLQVAFQDDINALQAALTDVSTQTTGLGTALTNIQAELTAGNPVTPAQLASLDTLASNATAITTALDAAVTSIGNLAPAPAPVPAPGGTTPPATPTA